MSYVYVSLTLFVPCMDDIIVLASLIPREWVSGDETKYLLYVSLFQKHR